MNEEPHTSVRASRTFYYPTQHGIVATAGLQPGTEWLQAYSAHTAAVGAYGEERDSHITREIRLSAFGSDRRRARDGFL